VTIHKFDETGGPSWPEVLESAPVLVLYKHSPVCMTSSFAQREIKALHKALPALPIYQVDVIHDRGLAHRMAADLQVRHESPQVVVVRDGRAVWYTSHFAVKVGTLLKQIERAQQMDAATAP
jgi:bacillithiol system protein YtxJ